MLFIRNYFAWIVVFFVQDAAWSSQGINSAPERTKRGPRSAGKHPCAYSVARSCARSGPRRAPGEAHEVPGQPQKVPEGPRRGPGRTPWMPQGTLGEARGGARRQRSAPRTPGTPSRVPPKAPPGEKNIKKLWKYQHFQK